MTNEEIRQNAAEYVLNFEPTGVIIEDRLKCYIAGAHSRDEEVEQWKESKRRLRLRLMQEIHELRNPWISVAERLPEKINKFFSDFVLVMYTRGGKPYPFITRYDYECGMWEIENVTHWMPIPELSPDEQPISGLKQMQQDLEKGGAK